MDHAGDRSPLALANREIGALPPQARKEAGPARRARPAACVSKALAARQAVLEEEHEARILVEEAVDVTLPWDRIPAGARHPVTTLSERIADVFVAMGWEVAEGPVVEAEWLNFDALNLGPDHPARTMQDTFWMEPAGERRRAAHPHLAGAGAHHAEPHPADLRRLPGPGVPHRRVRRDAQPGLPPGGGPRDRRGHHDGPPQGHPRPLRHRDVRRRHHDAVPPVVLPLHRAERRGRPGLLRLPGRGQRRAAAPARARAGSSGAAAAS